MEKQQNQLKGIGEAVDESLRRAWALWRKEYSPGLSNELAWTEKVSQITQETKILKGGRVRVTVFVQAQKPWCSDHYPFEYLRRGGDLELQINIR